MKFESLSEIQLLKLCLKTKRIQLEPRIFDYAQRLKRIFTPESVELLADISEEYHKAHINGKRPTAETIEIYQDFMRIAREHGDDAVNLVAAFRKSIINYQEFDRIINLNTDDKIIDIASAVGYDDVDFFGKIFKKYVNMSPAKYRKISG